MDFFLVCFVDVCWTHFFAMLLRFLFSGMVGWRMEGLDLEYLWCKRDTRFLSLVKDVG